MKNEKARNLIVGLLRCYENPFDALGDISEVIGEGIPAQAMPVTAALKRITYPDLIHRVLQAHGTLPPDKMISYARELEPNIDPGSFRATTHHLYKRGDLTRTNGSNGGYSYKLATTGGSNRVRKSRR